MHSCNVDLCTEREGGSRLGASRQQLGIGNESVAWADCEQRLLQPSDELLITTITARAKAWGVLGDDYVNENVYFKVEK